MSLHAYGISFLHAPAGNKRKIMKMRVFAVAYTHFCSNTENVFVNILCALIDLPSEIKKTLHNTSKGGKFEQQK